MADAAGWIAIGLEKLLIVIPSDRPALVVARPPGGAPDGERGLEAHTLPLEQEAVAGDEADARRGVHYLANGEVGKTVMSPARECREFTVGGEWIGAAGGQCLADTHRPAAGWLPDEARPGEHGVGAAWLDEGRGGGGVVAAGMVEEDVIGLGAAQLAEGEARAS